MSNAPTSRFVKQLEVKVQRKLQAQGSAKQSLGFGLGMMGLIGWSVAVPALIGTALGIWLDRTHPGPHPWTLALMIAGLTLGCFNAWHWIDQESKKIQEESK